MAAAAAVMRSQSLCTMITDGRSGPTARVVQPRRPDADLTVHVGTSPGSRKAKQVEATSSAVLAYQARRDQAGVVAYCTAEVVTDPRVRRRYFMPLWRAFWPAGPSHDFVVIRCVPHTLEVWDIRRGITPEPFGLRSGRVVRDGDTWVRRPAGER